MSFMVETSARHIHLTQETVEKLFGEGYQLTKRKDLSYPGQFACNERLTVVGPKREQANVSILGPVRKADQVELSATDARNLGIDTGKTPAEAVENLAKAVEDYRDNKLGMNKSFQDCGVDEDYFWSVLDQIGMRAYEDQCTPANPRIPLINDMKDIAVGAYYGVSQAEGHKLRIEREGEAATEEASER